MCSGRRGVEVYPDQACSAIYSGRPITIRVYLSCLLSASSPLFDELGSLWRMKASLSRPQTVFDDKLTHRGSAHMAKMSSSRGVRTAAQGMLLLAGV